MRLRKWGRWAAEIRVPGTHEKVWIGTFETDTQAALAYDAAVFCFYGKHPPRPRKFNFPAAPRPNIPENVRVQLSVASVKAAAKKHVRDIQIQVGLLPPPARNTTEPLQVSAAAAAGPSAGAGATADGNLETTADEDSLFPFESEEELVAAVVALVSGDN